jgi:hypothetical protein
MRAVSAQCVQCSNVFVEQQQGNTCSAQKQGRSTAKESKVSTVTVVEDDRGHPLLASATDVVTHGPVPNVSKQVSYLAACSPVQWLLLSAVETL